MQGPDKEKWENAIKEEMKAMVEFGVWDPQPVELPKGKQAVDSKIVLKIKTDEQGNPVKYKARFVARGFTQV